MGFSENMQQIYRTPMPKCNFIKVACNFVEIALRYGCSHINLCYIFRKLFIRTSMDGYFRPVNEHQNIKNQWYSKSVDRNPRYFREVIKLKLIRDQRCSHVNYIITNMIALTQITNTEIFAFMTVIVFKLLSRKVLFINSKDNKIC